MNKKDTKEFFDDLIRKIESMTREDFQKIEREKSDFFSSLENLKLDDDNFRLLELENLFEPEFFPSEYHSAKSSSAQVILEAGYTEEKLYLAA